MPLEEGSSADQVANGSIPGAALESEDEAHPQGVGQALECLHTRPVAAALDTGDGGVTCADAPGQLQLRDAEGGSMLDHDPGQGFERGEPILLGAVRGAAPGSL